ncbi:cell surface protein SprA [Rhizosphaericola mali]|uniref:Cell surface protein SprA n=1 Tax=Rhizosphaericola mali TaxID=2545455 RepID=A0A5P2GAB3_9BACT|nr:cell surface protein SprA [Rhizosphaericola mali]
MRAIPQTDFETNNIEYIEFWLQDPFLYQKQSTGGRLVFNLGNVSEDVLKDGKHFYENGLNTPTTTSLMDSTSTWGFTPLNPIQLTNAFSNTASDRAYQDIGFDGLDDVGERNKRATFLASLAMNFGSNSTIYSQAYNDPSNDNYVWYRDSKYDDLGANIISRYKYYNNPQGNSPVSTSTALSSAATMYPDNEDLNADNTLNETESYFEYDVDLKPGMSVGDSYIVDSRVITPKLANDSSATETWYLFRIPVKNYASAIGGISDFKSIRFMRMYMTNFRDSATFRFGSLNLVRNQWRNFTYDLDTTGSYTSLPSASTTTLTISTVGLEANSGKIPIPYKMPPGVEQMQSLANNGVNVLSNEQSMALDITNLKKGDARAVIKGMNMDMRRYGRMAMFIHAESITGQTQVNNGDLTAVIRIGQDYLNNYYEIKIPLSITLPSVTASSAEIWPTSNELELSLQSLVQAKLHRDNAGHSTTSIYRELQTDGSTISVMGSPNLAEVSGYLIGVQNDSSSQPLSAELWFDELRLSDIDNSGGWAAMGRVDIQMADLGTLSVSGNTYTAGFGTIEQSTNERSLNDMRQFDAAMNLDLGKLFPQKLGFTIPTYASITRTVYTPKYDPFDQDVLYKTKLAMAKTKAERDSIKNVALDQSTTKTLNFTNVRFARPGNKTPQLWDLSNFDFSYSYTSIRQSNPTIAKNAITRQHGGFGYTFNGREHYVEPFKKLFAKKSPWLGLFRDFNFNPVPSLLSFRVNVDRQMGLYLPRSINIGDTANTVIPSDTTYDKYFLIDRYYNLRWNFTRNLNFDFSAINNSIVDEPEGLINTKAKRDSVWKNFLKGGRTLTYQQKTILNYNLPLDKLPMTDWINAQYNFTTSYNWVSANLLALGLGNVVENGRQNGLQADMDFTRLYNKSKFFRKVNEPRNNFPNGNNYRNPNGQNNNGNNGAQLTMKPLNDTAHMKLPPRDSIIKGLHGKEKHLALKKWRALRRAIRKAQRAERANMQIADMNGFARAGGQLVTMVKRVSVQYTSAYNSRVPGIMASPNNFGNNWKAGSPGLGYVFGKQPTSAWLDKMASKGALSTDSLFNDVFSQSYTQSINITAQIQPVPSLNIDLNIQKSFSKQYNELFKDTLGNGTFSHLSPYASGGFSISYISLKTMFTKNSTSKTSKLFDNFSTFRTTISKRMAAKNGYYTGGLDANGYANGYGQYAQDVLIPAFLAAYTGKDPNKIPLVDENYTNIKQNPLSGYFPLPNWNLTYSGLSNIPALHNTFSSIVLTHAYNSTLSMNSFTSSLDYLDPLHLGVPGFINSTSGNYVPFYIIPNLTISESFAPLIGVNLTTKDQNNMRFQYAKSRTLSLSLTDYQVSEVNSTTYTIGGTYRKRNANLTFLPGNKKANAGNDLNITLDLAFRNDRQYNSILDQSSSYSTGGQKIISISPSIDYILSNRVNVKLYFDQQRIIPYISTTYPTTTTSAGIQIRVSLAQ